MEIAVKSSCGIEENNKLLINEIRDVCHQMAYTNTWFKMEDDNDLIEACIYQMEVLNARYRYLIRKARKDNISASPFNNNFLGKQAGILGNSIAEMKA